MNKVASIVAAVGLLLVAAGKFMTGELPNWTEVLLALTTLAAAFGFQKGLKP